MLNYKYNLKELLDILEKEKALDQFISDVFKFNLICDENYGIEETIFNPHIKNESKLKYLQEFVQPYIGKYFYSFICQLVINNDIQYYEFIRRKFLDLLSKEKQASYIEIISAIPLTQEQLERIKEILSQKLGQPAFVYNSTSRKIIGGFIINLGNKIIDLSIRGSLEKLKTAIRSY